LSPQVVSDSWWKFVFGVAAERTIRPLALEHQRRNPPWSGRL